MSHGKYLSSRDNGLKGLDFSIENHLIPLAGTFLAQLLLKSTRQYYMPIFKRIDNTVTKKNNIFFKMS